MRLPLLLGLSALAVASHAGAQGVTEEQFLSGFNQESAAVRALTEGVARAQAARRRAGVLANPRADFWREAPAENPRVTNWTLSWTPPLDGRHGLGKEAAEAGLAAARERLAADQASLRRELRAAFAAWSLACERRQSLAQQWERVRGLAEAERQRARVGEGSGLAARRLTLAEAEVRATFGTGEAQCARAEAVARAWRPDLAPDVAPARALPPEPPDTTDPSTTPELRALDFEAQQAVLEKRRARRFLSFPTLQVGWQRIADRGTARSGPILAAGWNIPLFDRDQAARVEAERREEVAAARAVLARARIAAEVEGGAAAYRALFAAWNDAGRASDEGDRVIEAATAAFRAGEASLTDLLDSLRAAVGARLSELDLRGQALEAHRELEAALGRPLTGGAF